ncbi:MAG: hypothetical protein U0V74_16230 [Chitinophagales bacterium]
MKKLYFLLAVIVLSLSATAQKSVGINTNDPKSTFDVNGNLALREGPSLVLSNGGASGGVNDNIVLPDITGLSGVKASFYRITGPTAAFSIYGVVPNSGADGQLVTLMNTTTNVMTVKNNASSIAANSIKTLSGTDMVTVAGMSSITLQYNKTDARWYVTGSENFTVSSTSLPTKDIVPGTGSAITVVNGANQVVGGGNVVVDVQTNGLGQKGIVPGPTGLNGNQAYGTDNAGNPAWGKVQNAQMQNSSVTVNTGTGLSGGGNVALGGTLNLTNTAPDQTVVLNSGTGISATGTYPNFTITNTGDLSTTNEGSLTVGAGTATTSLISSNTSGSTPVTLQAGSNVTLSETGNTITIASSNSGGTVTSIATTAPITGGTITTTGTIGLTQLGDVLAGTGVSVSGGTDKLPGSADVTITNTGVTSITGTTNQINVNQSTGAVTLSTPQNIHTGANVTFNSVTAPNDIFGRINVIDTRASDFAPNTFDNEVAFEFKARGSIAGTPGSGTYGGLMTLAPWGDNSGDLHHQLFFNNGGIFYRTGQPDNTTWNGWSQVLTSANIGSNINGTTNYVPKFTGANTIGNSLIYDNGGGIGIGTTGSARLHVSGGGMLLGTNGFTSNTRTLTILEDGDTQFNFGAYPGQWTSALQIQDNTTSRFVWLSPLDNGSGANARLVSAGSGFDIYTNVSIQAMSLSSSGAATFPSLSAGGLVKSVGGTLQIAGGGDLPAGSGNYIQNGTGSQSANFNITGFGYAGNYFQTPTLYVSNYRHTASTYENIYSDNNGSGGFHLFRNDGNSWGYFYGDNGGIGILKDGSWAVRATGSPNGTNSDVSFFTDGGSRRAYVSGSGLYFDLANPYINASSYFISPGGAYFNSGTVYFEAATQHRGGIQNDGANYNGYVRVHDDLWTAGWVRTDGATGWYSQTYGGGWNMQDNTWLRTYGNKAILASGGLAGYGNSVFGGTYGTNPRIYANYDNVGAGGIMVSDDGGFFDYNDAYIEYRGSTGLAVRVDNNAGGIVMRMTNTAGGSLADRRIITDNNAWGLVGASGNAFYQVWAYNHVVASKREWKKDITEVSGAVAAKVMEDLDRLHPYMYRYKEETDVPVDGQETKYRPGLHMGLIVDESPDYILSQPYDGVDIYAAATLGITAGKVNREDIKEIKNAMGWNGETVSVQDFGSIAVNNESMWVAFDAAFTSKLNGAVPVVTLTGNKSCGDIYITEKSDKGFRVKVAGDFNNLQLDYIAMAKVAHNAPKASDVPAETLAKMYVTPEVKRISEQYAHKPENNMENIKAKAQAEAVEIQKQRAAEIKANIASTDPPSEIQKTTGPTNDKLPESKMAPMGSPAMPQQK